MDKSKVAAGIMFAADALGFLYVISQKKITTTTPPSTPSTTAPSYTLTFTESGLPSGTTWSVDVSGKSLSSTTDTITFTLPAGTYQYVVNAPVGVTPTPDQGTITLNSDQTVSIQMTGTPQQPPQTSTGGYHYVTFVENGLYQYLVQGYTWEVTINGQTHTVKSVDFSIELPAGVYSFTITPPQGMTASPSSGTVDLTSSDQEITIDFTGTPTSPPPSQPTPTLTSKSWLTGWGTNNAQVFLWEFSDPDLQTAIQLSYKGPTESIQNNQIVWIADGNIYTGSRCIDAEGCAHLDAEAAYTTAHLNESTLVGFYWQGCLWFLYLLYPGVTVEEALGSSHGPLMSISSASQIVPGLSFIGPASALYDEFAATSTQGWGTPFLGCTQSEVEAHTVTFIEKGLPSGYAWGVSLEGPFSAVQGTTTTTGTSIQFIIPFAEKFSIPQAFGYNPSPSSGTVNPGDTVEITYTRT